MRLVTGIAGQVVLCLFAIALALAQSRFDLRDERLAGFTRSPTEHIMNEHPAVISVRALRGRITGIGSKTGIPGALIEVRKAADPTGKIRRSRTDESGRFRIRRLPEGEYVFKVTREGFQSTFGRLTLSGHASRESTFDIELKQGV